MTMSATARKTVGLIIVLIIAAWFLYKLFNIHDTAVVAQLETVRETVAEKNITRYQNFPWNECKILEYRSVLMKEGCLPGQEPAAISFTQDGRVVFKALSELLGGKIYAIETSGTSTEYTYDCSFCTSSYVYQENYALPESDSDNGFIPINNNWYRHDSDAK